MGKYSKYTGGQVEAVLNMIGGEPVMDGLLGGTIKVTAKAASSPTPERTMVTCQVFNGNRCTICGGFFADGGDTVCASGHEIGQHYEK
jgi:hypothetical protein